MKQTLLGLALSLVFLSACKNADDDNSNPNGGSLNGGLWQVTYFFDKDKVETSNFAGYKFEFQSDGTLVATLPDGSTRQGAWSSFNDDNLLRLGLIITGTEALDDFSDDDWVITEQTGNTIKLKDDSDTHLEEIHLERI